MASLLTTLRFALLVNYGHPKPENLVFEPPPPGPGTQGRDPGSPAQIAGRVKARGGFRVWGLGFRV